MVSRKAGKWKSTKFHPYLGDYTRDPYQRLEPTPITYLDHWENDLSQPLRFCFSRSSTGARRNFGAAQESSLCR